MRCLDLFGFFDGYSFDIDFCAAEKVYYCEAFDVFEAVGEENVYFFAQFGFLLIDFFVKVSSYFLKWIIAFFVWSYNVCLELSGSTRLRVLSLLVMDWDMFHRLKFLSVLLWLYLLTLVFAGNLWP